MHPPANERVLEAAIHLFAEKGFQGTKTKEIAEAAGINEALIFRYFRSKDNLYCAILEYASRRINAERWIQEVSGHAGERNDTALFSDLALNYLAGFSAEPNLYRLMLYSALENHDLACKFREAHTVPLERFIEQYIRTRQDEGAFRAGDPHTLARHFLNLCSHLVLRHVLFGPSAEPAVDAAAASALTGIFLDGVHSH